jgi:FeS assembly SUF system protein
MAETLEQRVIEALKTCYDPEIPVDVYELGLIYGLKVETTGVVTIEMTLTAPNCPAAGSLPGEIERKVREVKGVTDVKLELVWEPPWGRERLSPAALVQLGLM